jgi:hypothetical protein
MTFTKKINLFLIAVANLKAYAIMFSPPNGKPFGYQKFTIVKGICGRCPHPQPLKRLTKLLYSGRIICFLSNFVARPKLFFIITA